MTSTVTWRYGKLKMVMLCCPWMFSFASHATHLQGTVKCGGGGGLIYMLKVYTIHILVYNQQVVPIRL